MLLVKGGHIIKDAYVRVADDAPLPDAVPVILSADRFLVQAAALTARKTPIGVAWPNNRKVADIVPCLPQLALIALVFPTFRDGRAYSQARLLREQHGFRGELRATGQVLRDQFLFMLRAGFDAFEVTKDADAEAFPDAIRRYTLFYQPTGDGRPTIAGLRRQQEARAAALARSPS
jgi:uncharacterized protein (DUF934 family)